MSDFTKIRPVGTELLHTDGEWTGVKKLIVAFCNFAKIFNLKFVIRTCFVYCLTERKNFDAADCILVPRDQYICCVLTLKLPNSYYNLVQARCHNFFIGGGGGCFDPEALYNLFDFKNRVIKFMP
jgi:hypothetical protein